MPGTPQDSAYDQWRFDTACFQNTPSRSLDNLTTVRELQLRNEGIHFLLRCGNTLKLKSNVLCAASTYFHRFYLRYSIGNSGYDKTHIAATCLFLASKVEESTRKLRDVAGVCYVKFTSDSTMKESDKWATRILAHENLLLDAICFDLIVPQPHEFLAEALSGGVRDSAKWQWKGPLADKDMFDRGVYQLAWSIANDSLRLPLCLFYPPNLIACAAYLIAVVDTLSRNGTPPGSGNSVPEQPEAGRLPDANAQIEDGPPQNGDDIDITQELGDHPRGSRVTVDDILGGRDGAGNWKAAFHVDIEDTKALGDIIGNILELYTSAEPSPSLADLRQMLRPKGYESLTGLSRANGLGDSALTTNSSPALTLASNTTPMHRAVEESSQEYSTQMEAGTNQEVPVSQPHPPPTLHDPEPQRSSTDDDSMNLVD